MTPCEGGGSRRNTITIESLFEIDRDTQNVAWKRFLADSEWIEIKKVTAARWGDLVDDVQDLLAGPVALHAWAVSGPLS